ncbi:MAG: hypothetical protein MUE85_06020 [Microscillaceae bacterium]|jgi:hypothetical protein|nr:hypothetical protein [Microscillaceae bacterium]
MKQLLNYFLVWVGLLMGACETKTPDPAPPIAFEEFANIPENYPKQGSTYEDFEKFKQKYETRFALEGYLSLPRMFGLATETFGLDLRKNLGDSTSITAYFKLGAGKNQVKTPPDKYQDKDLEVYDMNGEKVGNQTKVRVHGKRSVVSDGFDKKIKQCYINVDRVEIVK